MSGGWRAALLTATEEELKRLPATKEEAWAQGGVAFFTGVPCRQGHLAARIAYRDGQNQYCLACRVKQERAYAESPEGLAVHRAARSRHKKTEHGRRDKKASQRRRRATPEGHQLDLDRQKRYRQSDHGKEVRRRWKESEKGREAIRECRRRYREKAKLARRRQEVAPA